MRYTKRDRALAILICQIAASGGVRVDERRLRSAAVLDIEEALGLGDSAAGTLACAAWFAPPMDIGLIGEARNAEAECLLRDGWSPGEPVVRLGGAA